MKYLFFVTGLGLVLVGVGLAVSGALEGWDAAISGAPLGIGVLLLIAAVIFHAVEVDRM